LGRPRNLIDFDWLARTRALAGQINFRSNHIYKKDKVKTKKILISLLIFLIKLIIFLKRLLTAFFIITFKPLKGILRFIFYKVVVKGYCFYFSLAKKLGWEKFKGSFLSFVFTEKLAHVFAIGLVVIVALANLTGSSKAGAVSDHARNTIMAGLIKNEFSDVGEDELIEESVTEGVAFSTQQSYLDGSAVIKNQPQALIKSPDDIEFSDSLAALNQEGSALVSPGMASTKKSFKPRTETIYYTVQPGDSISTIADEYSISVNTILWENNLSTYALIRPGDKLAILPMTGINHKVVRGENISQIAQKYGVTVEKIVEANSLGQSDRLAAGQKLIIPGGRKINYTVQVASSYTGLSAIKDLIIPPASKPVANKMNWPTVGNRITQYYSWRHTAIDIANKIGTPLYAADSGVVEFAGWSTGYGNNIIVNHGGGKKTRYAHLSKFYAKKGQEVNKGETIGAMGSTGWSTGSHIHFEVIIDGRKYNPLNYIR